MKKYLILSFLAAAAAVLCGCKETEGTDPGTGGPHVTIYQYTPSSEYNSDEDVVIRFAKTDATVEFYYLSEPLSDKEDYITSYGESGYMQYVMENGTQSDSDLDVIITGMAGEYAISAVAVGADGSRSLSESIFYGLSWTTISSGTYYFGYLSQIGGPESADVEFQVCDNDDTLYRFKDVFGTGYSVKIQALPEYSFTDGDDTWLICRIPNQTTPYSYGSYGTIYLRDVGYWQGDVTYVTEYGYDSGLCIDGPNKYSAYLLPAYYVSAGTLSYTAYDEFYPN